MSPAVCVHSLWTFFPYQCLCTVPRGWHIWRSIIPLSTVPKFHRGRVSSIALAIASPVTLCKLLNLKNSSWIYPSLLTKRMTSDSQFMHLYNIVTCDVACDAFLNWFPFALLQKRKSRLAEFRKGGSDTFSSWIIFIFITQKWGSRTPGTLPWLRPCNGVQCCSSRYCPCCYQSNRSDFTCQVHFCVGFPTLCQRQGYYLFVCPREQSVCHVVSTWQADWVHLQKVECFWAATIRCVITLTGCCFLANFEIQRES